MLNLWTRGSFGTAVLLALLLEEAAAENEVMAGAGTDVVAILKKAAAGRALRWLQAATYVRPGGKTEEAKMEEYWPKCGTGLLLAFFLGGASAANDD